MTNDSPTSSVEVKPEAGDPQSAPESEIKPQAEEEPSDTGAFLRLLAVLGAGAIAAILTDTVTTVLVVLAVILMIMVHELGHFMAAKWSGMKVTQYFLGFGPTLWSIRRGETEYGVKAIPAGGFVKIIGMSNLEKVDAEDEARTYRQQPYGQRMAVAVAGSFMHFVMAFVLLAVLYGALGTPSGPSTTVESLSTLQNGQSPAGDAGIRKGDKILAIDDQPVNDWQQAPAMLQKKAGVVVNIRVQRGNAELVIPVTAADRRTVGLVDGKGLPNPTTEGGFLGIRTELEYERSSPLAALGKAAQGIGSGTVQVVQSIGNVFSPSGLSSWFSQVKESTADKPATPPPGDPSTGGGDGSANRLLSPVGLVSQANYAADAGLRETLFLLFSINLFVGIFNMVPLLPFDGGHVAVATYERLRSRRGRRYMVDFAKLLPISYAVLLILVALSLSALWLDIVNPVPNVFQ